MNSPLTKASIAFVIPASAVRRGAFKAGPQIRSWEGYKSNHKNSPYAPSSKAVYPEGYDVRPPCFSSYAAGSDYAAKRQSPNGETLREHHYKLKIVSFVSSGRSVWAWSHLNQTSQFHKLVCRTKQFTPIGVVLLRVNHIHLVLTCCQEGYTAAPVSVCFLNIHSELLFNKICAEIPGTFAGIRGGCRFWPIGNPLDGCPDDQTKQYRYSEEGLGSGGFRPLLTHRG